MAASCSTGIRCPYAARGNASPISRARFSAPAFPRGWLHWTGTAMQSALKGALALRPRRAQLLRGKSVLRVHWRYFLMVAIVAGSLVLMLWQQPFRQDPAYHDFADRRTFFGIPNFFDVTSNLAFLLVGIAGLRTSLRSDLDRSRYAWVALF